LQNYLNFTFNFFTKNKFYFSVKSVFLFIAILFFITSCYPTRLVKENQYLVYSQSIKGNKAISNDKLTSLFKQKTNRRLLGTPIMLQLYAYQVGSKRYDKSKIEEEIRVKNEKYDKKIASETNEKKIKTLKTRKKKKIDKLNTMLEDGNWIMRNLGSKPIFIDSSLIIQTQSQIELYLTTKGFFKAKTEYKINYDKKHKTANVTYLIVENTPYMFENLYYNTDDCVIDSILNANIGDTFIEKNVRYDRDKLDSERERIEKLMRNTGYFGFTRQYERILVDDTIKTDSTLRKGFVDIFFNIIDPNEGFHQRYTVDKIYFTVDANVKSKNKNRDTTIFNNIHYLGYNKPYTFKSLNSKVTIQPNQYYNQKQALETQKRLNNLDIFKFANFVFDTLKADKLKINIFASPLDKYQTSEEVGGTVSQGLPGPFLSWTFKVRNPFRGFEVFETTARAAIEGQLGFLDPKPYASEVVNISSSLILPKIVFPTKFRFKFDSYNPKTRLLVSYNYTNRPEYNRKNFRAAMIYTWQPSLIRNFTVNLIDINYVNTVFKSDDFKKYLDTLQLKGNSLKQSFNTAFISSFSASYIYNDFSPLVNTPARYWRLSGEVGGNTLNFLPSFQKGNDEIGNIQYYRFYRLGAEYRFYLPVSKKTYLVTRINTGLANSYGNTLSLPYEKFYFSGGSNSMRAWAPRRVGLGSALPIRDTSIKQSLTNPYLFEQPGNILLELNAEYRFPVFKYLKMALFVDAGNVWRIQPFKDRPNADFNVNRFYKEIALGTGIGFRFDFTFVILRLDVGTKLYNPNMPEGDKWMSKNLSFKTPFGVKQQTVLNIGIGYPF